MIVWVLTRSIYEREEFREVVACFETLAGAQTFAEQEAAKPLRWSKAAEYLGEPACYEGFINGGPYPDYVVTDYELKAE